MVSSFALNGISFLFVIAAILGLRDVHASPITTESMATQLRAGLRLVRESSNLATVTVLAFFTAFFGMPLLTFLPIITRDVFHRDVGFYTYLMTFSGTGAVTGALAVAWLGGNLGLERMLPILLTLLGTTIVGFGLSRNSGLSALILFAGGSLFVMCSSLTNSLVQLLAPTKFRGRVLSIYLVASLGGAPFGALASGWLVTRVGSAPLMLVVNGTALTLVALFFLSRGWGLEGSLP